MNTTELLEKSKSEGPLRRVADAGRVALGQAGVEARKAAALAELAALEPILAEAEASRVRVKGELNHARALYREACKGNENLRVETYTLYQTRRSREADAMNVKLTEARKVEKEALDKSISLARQQTEISQALTKISLMVAELRKVAGLAPR